MPYLHKSVRDNAETSAEAKREVEDLKHELSNGEWERKRIQETLEGERRDRELAQHYQRRNLDHVKRSYDRAKMDALTVLMEEQNNKYVTLQKENKELTNKELTQKV